MRRLPSPQMQTFANVRRCFERKFSVNEFNWVKHSIFIDRLIHLSDSNHLKRATVHLHKLHSIEGNSKVFFNLFDKCTNSCANNGDPQHWWSEVVISTSLTMTTSFICEQLFLDKSSFWFFWSTIPPRCTSTLSSQLVILQWTSLQVSIFGSWIYPRN